MVDTIELRVHRIGDINIHIAMFVEALRNGIDKSYIDYTADDMKRIGDTPKMYKDYYYKDTDNHYFIEVNRKGKENSYGYSIELANLPDKDYTLIRFSIPKWLYGTNVLQFVPSGINGVSHENDNFDLRRTYDAFFEAIDYLFKTEFMVVPIDRAHVEISRIDLCYNMVFNNKHDCKEYFEHMKTVKKKYAKVLNSTVYGSTVAFKTRYSYAKVYMKGVEFATHDKGKLHNINKKEKIFDIKNIQELADRTLRYEVTFRPEYLNYNFKRKVFRRKNKDWTRIKKEYNKYFNGEKADVHSNAYTVYKNMCNNRKLVKELYVLKRWYGRIGKTWMYLNSEHEVSDEPEFGNFGLSGDQGFSFALWEVICEKFFGFVKDMQLSDYPTRHELETRIDKRNADADFWNKNVRVKGAKRRIWTKAKLVLIHELLKFKRWQEIEDAGLFGARSAMYDIKRKFKELGMHKGSVLLKPIPVKTDNEKYISFIHDNPELVKQKRLVNFFAVN
jgi:hypothetical protein